MEGDSKRNDNEGEDARARQIVYGDFLEPLRREEEGDLLRLPAPGGEVSLKVAGVYYDYTTDGGFVVVDREFLKKHWQDDRLSALGDLSHGRCAAGTGSQNRSKKFSTPTMVLISNRRSQKTRIEHIRSDVRHHVCAGVHRRRGSSSRAWRRGLSSNILERVHEIARAARPWGSTARESYPPSWERPVIIGVLSVLVGLASGVCLAAILIFVVNKLSFGWTIQYIFAWKGMAAYLLVVVLASLARELAPGQERPRGSRFVRR